MASSIIGLKSPDGLIVGEAHDADRSHIEFSVVGELRPGQSVAFRLELSRADDTVLGDLRVAQLLSGRVGELQRYVAHITGIDPRDQLRFQQWVEDLAQGRNPWRLRVLVQDGVMHGTTEGETRGALSAMDARRAKARRHMEERGRWDEDTGEIFIHDVELGGASAPMPSPDAAARSPQRSAGLPVEQRPISSDPFADEPTLTRVPAILDGEEASEATESVVPPGPLTVDPSTGEVKTAPPLHQAAPPRAFASRGPEGDIVSVTWSDLSSLQRSVVDGLAAGFLSLDHDALAFWPSACTVRMVTPDHVEVEAPARLISRDGPQVLYQLDLDDVGRSTLLEEAAAQPG